MKKTILQYMTDIYQEDIPKHILQENKIRLNSFFLEQESVQKKGTQFIFRYAFYSVEKPRKITKQHLLKEYAGVPLEKRSFCQRKKIPLLFVSLKGMIDDIRFLNLLEESHVDFRCIDFPWFCKENLPLIKAVVLYEKLEIRINV